MSNKAQTIKLKKESKMAIYLQVDFSTGSIFRYSKTEQEGYEPHTNTKGVVSYRQIFKKGLYGTLKSVSLRDSDFGKEISLALTDKNGEQNYLNFPLFDVKKNIATYAESFITVLPQIKVGGNYRIYPYNIKEEGKKYATIGVSVLPADIQNETVNKEDKLVKLTYTYTKEGVEVKGDIPAILWEEDYTGAKTMNSTAKNKFLYEVLMANVLDSNAPTQTNFEKKTENKTILTASPSQAFEPVDVNTPKVEMDSLPF